MGRSGETSRRKGKHILDAPSASSADCYIINKISVQGTGNGLEPHEMASFGAGDCAVIVSAGQDGMAFRKLGMEVWKAANCASTAWPPLLLLSCPPSSSLPLPPDHGVLKRLF